MLPSCHVPDSHEVRRASAASSSSGSSVPSCGGAQPAAQQTAGNLFAALDAQPLRGVKPTVGQARRARLRRAAAIVRIQACWRRALVRWARPRAAAATRIQAHWRRGLVRLRRAADGDSEYDSDCGSDCTSYPVFEETDEILEMTALELVEESRFGGDFRW